MLGICRFSGCVPDGRAAALDAANAVRRREPSMMDCNGRLNVVEGGMRMAGSSELDVNPYLRQHWPLVKPYTIVKRAHSHAPLTLYMPVYMPQEPSVQSHVIGRYFKRRARQLYCTILLK